MPFNQVCAGLIKSLQALGAKLGGKGALGGKMGG
nr:MAG TPA: hypothetical protein [Caudoviricetes sp.]